ncbi:MAG: helix-turn-helix domain-containing protein [Candidatus Paracaedibacteraceae bacterium]|nr:helix-turn-helix domain-containing protein [Candidatus Paracaedibacteraceae bacterium]
MIYLRDILELGQQLRWLRKQTKLSQSDLALRAGLSRTAIQAIESGKTTCQLDTLFKVLTVLNIKLAIDHSLLKAPTHASTSD